MDNSAKITWVECPRDAMQGWSRLFSFQEKVDYLQALSVVGFDLLDAGSFVSPRAIPQMAETAKVLSAVDWSVGKKPSVLVIVGNQQGAERALSHEAVDVIGYPFSLSETFQQRNTNRSREKALEDIEILADWSGKAKKEMVVYLSMAFGNPYGEVIPSGAYVDSLRALKEAGVSTVRISYTIGTGTPDTIYEKAIEAQTVFPSHQLGMHLHVSPGGAEKALEAAWNSGIRRFDTAIRGIGGCPYAQDRLVGNMPSEALLSFLSEKKAVHGVSSDAFEKAYREALHFFT